MRGNNEFGSYLLKKSRENKREQFKIDYPVEGEDILSDILKIRGVLINQWKLSKKLLKECFHTS